MEKRDKEILDFIRSTDGAASSDVHKFLIKNAENLSLVSVKRILSRLESAGILKVNGAGPSTSYVLSEYGKLVSPVDAAVYNAIDQSSLYKRGRDCRRDFKWDDFMINMDSRRG